MQQTKLIAFGASSHFDTELSGTVNSDDPIEELTLSQTFVERREIQRRMTLLGYCTRDVDKPFEPEAQAP